MGVLGVSAPAMAFAYSKITGNSVFPQDLHQTIRNGMARIYYDHPYMTIPTLMVGGALAGRTIVDNFYNPFTLRESLISPNNDRRVRVGSPNTSPYCINGYMEMVFRGQKICDKRRIYVGSGTLISGEYILTAGHNLKDEKGQMAEEVKFYPGRNGSELILFPGGKTHLLASQSDLFVPPAYIGVGRSCDVGIVRVGNKFKDFIERKIGFASYGINNGEDFSNVELTLTGYPGERDKTRFMYTMSGKVTEAHQGRKRLYYDIDTTGGQSGSGIALLETGRAPNLKAVHTHGFQCSVFSPKSPWNQWNSGTMLHGDILDFIKKIAV